MDDGRTALARIAGKALVAAEGYRNGRFEDEALDYRSVLADIAEEALESLADLPEAERRALLASDDGRVTFVDGDGNETRVPDDLWNIVAEEGGKVREELEGMEADYPMLGVYSDLVDSVDIFLTGVK